MEKEPKKKGSKKKLLSKQLKLLAERGKKTLFQHGDEPKCLRVGKKAMGCPAATHLGLRGTIFGEAGDILA
jgi:hypothetical protein